jgi:hypothetical protein
MKTYIVYSRTGEEIAYIKAGSHNSAERKAISRYGKGVSVAYTEM